MRPPRPPVEFARRLRSNLGAPGLMIGAFSLLSFVFGLFIFAREYDRPRQTGRDAIHRVIAHWVRVPDYLGLTLVDYADLWRVAAAGERPAKRSLLRAALGHLGEQLDRESERFPLVRVTALELTSGGPTPLAAWRSPAAGGASTAEALDRIGVIDSPGRGGSVELLVRYRIAPTFETAARGLETSYHRLLLALLGLSGFSLLCFVYMILHAQSLSERVAREAAQEATLDLADRTCHELGNGIFVLANERRNLAEHLDLIERFVEEEPAAREAAARRAGLGPEAAARWRHALEREYGARGIAPGLEIRGSAAIARHVCRQIDVCTEYIRMTVRELDGFLNRSAVPVELGRVDVAECLGEALALLGPRLDAAGTRVVTRVDAGRTPSARADRRLLIHALVNLLKNAAEAAAARTGPGPPEVVVSVRNDGSTVWTSVADNGPGVPEALRRRVFEDRYSTKGSGRGRGLAIVRESVHLQGGQIEVLDAEAGGAEFRVGLPADPDPAA